jgi:hypothetical protein
MASYRYLFADLVTNSILAELQITNVSFTQTLNSAGTFQGSLLLSGVPAAANVDAATIPGRCALYVDRDGVLVWGGIIWSREYNSDDQHISITAREFESYFERRRLTSTLGFTSQDQLLVARTLMNTAQAVTGGNIGVQVGAEVSGVLISRVFYSYELKNVYQALLDLSRSSDGFDFNIQVAYDGGGNPTKTLVLGYPLSGTRYSSTSVTAPVFEFPSGNILSYTYPEDGSIAANTLYVVGAGSNEGKVVVTATDTTKVSTGWPLLEDSANFSDFTDTALLADLAAGQLAAVSYPPTTLKLVSQPSQSPVLGTYKIGDDIRVRITDDRFPTGLDAIYRLVALSLTAGEAGPERVTLTLTVPTS